MLKVGSGSMIVEIGPDHVRIDKSEEKLSKRCDFDKLLQCGCGKEF